MSRKLPANIITYMPHEGPSVMPSPMVAPKPLLTLLPHPDKEAPPCPPRPALPPPPKGWTSSLHAAPAAYPKGVTEAYGNLSRSSRPYESGPPPANETKEQRKKRLYDESNRCVKLREDAYEWTIEEAKAQAPKKGQWLCVERWRRDKPVGGATLVVTHANGLIKEVSARYKQDLWLTRTSTGTSFSVMFSRVTPSSPAPSLARVCLFITRPTSSLTTSG